MRKGACLVWTVVAVLACGTALHAASLEDSLQRGTVELQSAGPLAFGPEGILFVGDPQAAAVVAIATGDKWGDPEAIAINVPRINEKIAAALGTTPRDILINDLAVNPLSGMVYLSVSRGRGPDAQAVLLRVSPRGQIAELSLKDVKFAKAQLPDAPADAVVQQGRRSQNLRQESITDLAYIDGRLLVAGLSNEDFASTLRSIPFPFKQVDKGTAVEIYHGSHGRFETRSPVRTFAPLAIQGEPHLLAAYTCTPLVKFPLRQLEPGAKIQGITVAELGNRNRPLDMFVYEKDGKQFILMANSSRGVMKISTDGIERQEGITQPIRGTAGQPYETLAQLKDVVQLDRLNSHSAVALIEQEDGSIDLQTIPLP